MGYDEFDSQILALKKYKKKGDISFMEVSDMKVYENDRDIKVSNLYLKLPQNMINKISNIAISFSHLLTRREKAHKTNKKSIHFNL